MTIAAPMVIPKGSLPLPPRDELQPQPFSIGVPPPTPESLLPPGAAARLKSLRQHAADVHALMPDFETRQAASAAKLEAEARLRRLTDHAQSGGFGLGDGTPQVTAAQKAVSEATAETERLHELYKTRSVQRQAAARALAAVEDWLRNGRPRGTVLQDHDGATVKLLKGENSLLDAIANRRRRVSELKAELTAVEHAPFPSSHCKQRVREQVQELATRGAVSVAGLVKFDDDVKFARAATEVSIHNAGPGAIAFAEPVDTAGLLAWLHKDQLIAKLDAAIDAASDDTVALYPEERQRRAAELGESLLEVERAECSLVWRALSQNLPVEFRSDCSPMAVLECTLVTTRG